jgi:hypothetical protein
MGREPEQKEQRPHDKAANHDMLMLETNPLWCRKETRHGESDGELEHRGFSEPL